MNCSQNDRYMALEEPVTPSEAASFLATIQTLPSAHFRTNIRNGAINRKKSRFANIYDSPSLISSPSDDEAPVNICQDVWGSREDDNCACAVDVEDADTLDPSLAYTNSFMESDSFRGSVVKRTSVQDENQAKDGALLDVKHPSRTASHISHCSVLTEMMDEFERGRVESSPTRRGLGDAELKKDKSSVVESVGSTGKRKKNAVKSTLSRLSLLKNKTKQVNDKETVALDSIVEASDDNPAAEDSESLKLVHEKFDEATDASPSISTMTETVSTSNTAPTNNGLSPPRFLKGFKSRRSLNGAAAVTAKQSDKANTGNCPTPPGPTEDPPPVHLMSLSSEDASVSTSNTAPTNQGFNNETPSRFLKGFRSRRSLNGAAAGAASIPIVAATAKPGDRANTSKCPTLSGPTEDSFPVHLMSLSPEDVSVSTSNTAPTNQGFKNGTPSKFFRGFKSRRSADPLPVHLSLEDTPMKYDEICYGSSSRAELVTPAPPSPVDYKPHENSIVKTGADVPQETVLEDVPALPPIAECLFKQSVTNGSVELDATASVTMTPESTDYLNVSNDSELSEKCRSFLSDVSRTLFPADKAKAVAVEDINFDGLGDDDAFECMLNDEIGRFDVTVEDMRVEDAKKSSEVADEGTNPVETTNEEEKQVNEPPMPTSGHILEEQHKGKVFSDLFQIDMAAFGDLFGCTSSASKEVKSIVTEEKRELEVTKPSDDKNDYSAEMIGKQLSWADDFKDVNAPVYDVEIATELDNISVVDKTESAAKLGWIKSLRSRSSSMSLRKPSFRFGSTGEELDQRWGIQLEIMDEDIEATL